MADLDTSTLPQLPFTYRAAAALRQLPASLAGGVNSVTDAAGNAIYNFGRGISGQPALQGAAPVPVAPQSLGPIDMMSKFSPADQALITQDLRKNPGVPATLQYSANGKDVSAQGSAPAFVGLPNTAAEKARSAPANRQAAGDVPAGYEDIPVVDLSAQRGGMRDYSSGVYDQMPARAAGPASPARIPIAGGLIDPSAAIERGFNQQRAYQNASLRAIMDAASEGNPDNYSYRLAHLTGAIGQNNFGAIQVQGVDALNHAIAGITAPISVAGINAESAMSLQENRPQQLGATQEVGADGLVRTVTNTGLVNRRGAITPLAQEAVAGRKPVIAEGTTGKDKYNNPAVRRNGQWEPVK